MVSAQYKVYLVKFNLLVWLWKACTEVHGTHHLQLMIFYPLCTCTCNKYNFNIAINVKRSQWIKSETNVSFTSSKLLVFEHANSWRINTKKYQIFSLKNRWTITLPQTMNSILSNNKYPSTPWPVNPSRLLIPWFQFLLNSTLETNKLHYRWESANTFQNLIKIPLNHFKKYWSNLVAKVYY